MHKFQINMDGPMQVYLPNKSLLNLRGQKAIALLALLATSPTFTRSRRWIEAKLWSDRGSEQASASLRQSLAEIRKEFGEFRHLIISDRVSIWLDQQAFDVNLPKENQTTVFKDEEFLAGIDVKDQEFEDWLRSMRAKFTASHSITHAHASQTSATDILFQSSNLQRPAKLQIGLVDKVEDGLDDSTLNDIIKTELGKLISERVYAETRISSKFHVDKAQQCQLLLSCDLEHSAGTTSVYVKAIEQSTGRVLCSNVETFEGSCYDIINHGKTVLFLADLSEQIINRMPDSSMGNADATLAIEKTESAVAHIFSYESERIASAEKLLIEANNILPSATNLAWLAWQKTTQVIENTIDDHATASEQAEYYLRLALEIEPHNSLVNSIASLIYIIHFDRISLSWRHAERALRLSRFNPYAHAAIATANMFAGHQNLALTHSIIGSKLTRFTSNKHWWNLSHSLCCLAKGNFNQAQKHAELASFSAPKFRAPKRILLALYANSGDQNRAKAVTQDLRSVEPDFEIDRFLRDTDYPNTTVRNAGLLMEHSKFDLF